jgi:hypothetical protein
VSTFGSKCAGARGPVLGFRARTSAKSPCDRRQAKPGDRHLRLLFCRDLCGSERIRYPRRAVSPHLAQRGRMAFRIAGRSGSADATAARRGAAAHPRKTTQGRRDIDLTVEAMRPLVENCPMPALILEATIRYGFGSRHPSAIRSIRAHSKAAVLACIRRSPATTKFRQFNLLEMASLR